MREVFVVLLKISVITSLNMDDILNADYLLPVSNWQNEIIVDGNATWSDALSTMSFHRSKMNEYLCRSYLAADVVSSLADSSETTVGKRMGTPRAAKDMLTDAGSSGYKDWLSRSTTLEDIYRHYEGLKEAADAPVPQAIPPGQYDGGQVTGYAMMGGKDSGHSGFGVGTSYGVPEYGSSQSSGDQKGMKLKELFHLALTGVAFLAFKMFLIEVIMCIFDKHTDEDKTMMMMTAAVPAASFKEATTEPPLYGEKEGERSQRSIQVAALNTMAARVLATIEALSVVHQDSGQCLRRTLCEANKYSRTLPGLQRIWLPLWSLGASWIAGRVAGGRAPSSHNMGGLLGHLQAVLLGLGDADCLQQYPQCAGVGRQSRRKRQL